MDSERGNVGYLLLVMVGLLLGGILLAALGAEGFGVTLFIIGALIFYGLH